MLRLSRRLDYAILAVAHLADPQLTGPVSARAISERSRIPSAVLANILKELSKLGVIHSVRGAHGGYELAKPPAELSVGDLLRQIEGAPKLVECVPDELGSEGGGSCDLLAACPIKAPLRKLHDRIHQVLDELSFDELAVTGWSRELVAPEARGEAAATERIEDDGAEAGVGPRVPAASGDENQR